VKFSQAVCKLSCSHSFKIRSRTGWRKHARTDRKQNTFGR